MSEQIELPAEFLTGWTPTGAQLVPATEQLGFGGMPERPVRPRGFKVKGTFNPDIPCTADCVSARGRRCECSCGGKNHGRGYWR